MSATYMGEPLVRSAVIATNSFARTVAGGFRSAGALSTSRPQCPDQAISGRPRPTRPVTGTSNSGPGTGRSSGRCMRWLRTNTAAHIRHFDGIQEVVGWIPSSSTNDSGEQKRVLSLSAGALALGQIQCRLREVTEVAETKGLSGSWPRYLPDGPRRDCAGCAGALGQGSGGAPPPLPW